MLLVRQRSLALLRYQTTALAGVKIATNKSEEKN
jgi:hypothetical protein